jgi:hypothetical protein
LASSFVLGYHGCDRKVAERVLSGAAFRPSQNDFDWLGHGVYFWEANPARGLEFAREAPRRGHRIANPTVIGAVIDLGLCLDLTTLLGIHHVQAAHGRLVEMAAAAGYDLPQNGPDLLRRNLDCAVIEVLHDIRKDSGETPIDTVRGVFLEGSPIFEGSGFYAKTHIQICVCNPACIKGVFRVPKDQLS